MDDPNDLDRILDKIKNRWHTDLTRRLWDNTSYEEEREDAVPPKKDETPPRRNIPKKSNKFRKNKQKYRKRK